MKYPCFVIHRQQDVEREPLVDDLKKVIPHLQVIEPINGMDLIDLPRQHPGELKQSSLAVMSLCMTHCIIMKHAIQNNYEKICIFEDDAVIEGNIDFFIQSRTRPWDILYLGVIQVIKGKLIDFEEFEHWGCYEVQESWGTHAMILNQKAMKAIRDCH